MATVVVMCTGDVENHEIGQRTPPSLTCHLRHGPSHCSPPKPTEQILSLARVKHTKYHGIIILTCYKTTHRSCLSLSFSSHRITLSWLLSSGCKKLPCQRIYVTKKTRKKVQNVYVYIDSISIWCILVEFDGVERAVSVSVRSCKLVHRPPHFTMSHVAPILTFVLNAGIS